VLNLMCIASAPLLPFVSEAVYHGLNGEASSVHLQDFADVSGIDSAVELVADMDWVQDICNAASAIRNKQNIRNRQPLASLAIYGTNPRLLLSQRDGSGSVAIDQMIEKELEAPHWVSMWVIIQDELNVKTVKLFVRADDFEKVATRKLVINSQVLGKILPDKMKQILPASKKGEWKYVDGGIDIAGSVLKADEGTYNIVLEAKPEFKDSAQTSADNVVILDLTITPELEAEGRAGEGIFGCRVDPALQLRQMVEPCRRNRDRLFGADHAALIVGSGEGAGRSHATRKPAGPARGPSPRSSAATTPRFQRPNANSSTCRSCTARTPQTRTARWRYSRH